MAVPLGAAAMLQSLWPGPTQVSLRAEELLQHSMGMPSERLKAQRSHSLLHHLPWENTDSKAAKTPRRQQAMLST